MDHAFYYPLFLGVFLNQILLNIRRRVPFTGTSGYRLYSNLYNAGVATLTHVQHPAGVLEIAGGSSGLVMDPFYAGLALAVIGAIVIDRFTDHGLALWRTLTPADRYNFYL
jgi:hypothetical protein